jgi:Astacin (Peptidase family M12A)
MFLICGLFLIELLILKTSAGSIIYGLQTIPPQVKYGVNQEAFDKTETKSFWPSFGRSPTDDIDNDEEFIWEKSGLYEGDIMYYKGESKNGITEESHRWTNATIPFFIEEDHFSDDEIKTILTGIKEFHKKTCLRLRPYKKSDDNWVFITGDSRGCWSSVGMKNEGGQQLNVNSPACVKKGVGK